jgi:hypothetical protein
MNYAAVTALCLVTAAAQAGEPQTWTCEYPQTTKDGKPYLQKQQWIVSGNCTVVPSTDCRMTAPRGKGFYLVVHDDENLLISFHKYWGTGGFAPSEYIIIDKKTGRYLDMNDGIVSSMGPQYRDFTTPIIEFGHCSPSEIVPIEKKK